MRTIEKRITLYECGVCKVKYSNKKEAQKCERRELEPKKFKKDDVVEGSEKHVCDHGRGDVNFTPRGTIVNITGPEVMDEEYSLKWLGGKLFNQHVRQYLVLYPCFCSKEREHLYYSVELKKI